MGPDLFHHIIYSDFFVGLFLSFTEKLCTRNIGESLLYLEAKVKEEHFDKMKALDLISSIQRALPPKLAIVH